MLGQGNTSTDDKIDYMESSPNRMDCDDEIVERATFFVKAFVKKFEKKILECFEEVKPDSKTRKPGKTLTHVNSIVNNVIPPSPLKLGICKMSEGIDLLAAK